MEEYIGHVSRSVELHFEQEMEGKCVYPKNFCLRALPMYCPVQNLMRQVFCESVIVGVGTRFMSFYLLE